MIYDVPDNNNFQLPILPFRSHLTIGGTVLSQLLVNYGAKCRPETPCGLHNLVRLQCISTVNTAPIIFDEDMVTLSICYDAEHQFYRWSLSYRTSKRQSDTAFFKILKGFRIIRQS